MNASTSTSNQPTSTQSNAANGAAEVKIKRPNNAWIIFLKARAEALKDEGLGARELTKFVSKEWKAMSKDEQRPWMKKAEDEAKSHKAQYPGYKYQPGPPRKSKKNEEIKTPDDTSASTAKASSSSKKKKTRAKGKRGPRAISSHSSEMTLEPVATLGSEQVLPVPMFEQPYYEFERPQPIHVQQQTYAQLAMANSGLPPLDLEAAVNVGFYNEHLPYIPPTALSFFSTPQAQSEYESPWSRPPPTSGCMLGAAADAEARKLMHQGSEIELLNTAAPMSSQETWSQLGLSSDETHLLFLSAPDGVEFHNSPLRDIHPLASSNLSQEAPYPLSFNLEYDTWSAMLGFPSRSSDEYPRLSNAQDSFGNRAEVYSEADKENIGLHSRLHDEERRRDKEDLEEMLPYITNVKERELLLRSL